MEGMYSKIVGVTKENEDGTSRQDLIAELKPGDPVTFERDYDNEHDENAIAVYNQHGEQLGFIRAALAETLAPVMDSGDKVVGMVAEITGGGMGESYGCNIRIEIVSSKPISSPVSAPTSFPASVPASDPSSARASGSSRNALIIIIVAIAAIVIVLLLSEILGGKSTSNSSHLSTASYTRPVAPSTQPTTEPTVDSSIFQSVISVKSCKTDKPNSADGVDFNITFKNTSDKTIKYITFSVVPYNAVDDIVTCSIRDRSTFRGQITGPIDPSQKYDAYYWNCAWYNNTIVRAEIVGVDIEYMDGSKLSVPKEYIDMLK